jgi:hypothetical protein
MGTKKQHWFDREELAQIIAEECFYLNWDQVKGTRMKDIMGAVQAIEAAGYRKPVRSEPAQDSDQICRIPPAGWVCTRRAGHDGPCAALPLADSSGEGGGSSQELNHHGA